MVILGVVKKKKKNNETTEITEPAIADFCFFYLHPFTENILFLDISGRVIRVLVVIKNWPHGEAGDRPKNYEPSLSRP